jgi:integrase/recombinase XerD
MRIDTAPTTLTVTVFTRHAEGCTHAGNAQWKRCQCRKHLYIRSGGKTVFMSAKTRSWEKAEQLARQERERRDPANEGRVFADAAKAKQEESQRVSFPGAVDQWLASLKLSNDGTRKIYDTTTRKLKVWAAGEGIAELRDVTPLMLDRWRGKWSSDADNVDDRMAPGTQTQFQGRIKAFFRWVYDLQLVDRDPARSLKSITAPAEPTMPLSPNQFEAVLKATSAMLPVRKNPDCPQSPEELRALFLLMRWSGLRISDALTLSRSSLRGNNLMLKTIKTGANYRGTVPDIVVTALETLELVPGRSREHFFWSKRTGHRTLTNNWTRAIKLLNANISLRDENGKPMAFRSHQLRDTFAVELLLAGVSLEDLSRLLTHTSIKTTEKHYAPWVRARRDQLSDKLVVAMRSMGATVSMN